MNMRELEQEKCRFASGSVDGKRQMTAANEMPRMRKYSTLVADRSRYFLVSTAARN
jgi:hypothetical protein